MTLALQLFLTFFKVGCLSFGGGMAVIALIYDEIQSFGLVTTEQFSNIVAISQGTPGPVSVNVATFIGYSCDGLPGSIAATLGVVIPSFVLTILVYKLIGERLDNKYIRGALAGGKCAVVGMIGSALVVIALPVVRGDSSIISGLYDGLSNLPFDPIAALIIIATLISVGKLKKSPVITMLVMGCLGMLLSIC